MSPLWIAVLVTAFGCYALKLAGVALPQRLLENPRVRRVAGLVPVALIVALVLTQTFAADGRLELDTARLAGMGAAVVALVVRAPFLIVLLVAVVVTAGTRFVGLG